MKYTKGPWRIGDAAHTIFGPPSGNPSPETIANLVGSNHRANALLISKSPTMFEALISIRARLASDEWTNDDFDHMTKIVDSALEGL